MENKATQFDTPEDYWNDAAKQVAPNDKEWVYTNFYKKPKIARHLLEYDWTGRTILEVGAEPRVYPGSYDEYVASTGREAPGMRALA